MLHRLNRFEGLNGRGQKKTRQWADQAGIVRVLDRVGSAMVVWMECDQLPG